MKNGLRENDLMVSSTVLWGILLALLATFLFNISPILQKSGLNEIHEIAFENVHHSLKKMIANKKWTLGLILGLLGGIPYVIAVNLTGVTIVEPMINTGFILIAIMAVRYLKEKMHLWDYIAIFSLIIMPFFLALSNVSRPTHDMTLQKTQIALLTLTGGMMIGFFICIYFARFRPIIWTLALGLLISLCSIYLQATMSLIMFAGYSFTDDFSLIIKNLWVDPNLTLAFITGMIAFVLNFIMMYVYQVGLHRVPASKMIPISQTIDNFTTVSAGIWIFGQVIGNWVFYSIAFAVSVFGTLILGKYQIKK
jgi:uncharacterized membrane protein